MLLASRQVRFARERMQPLVQALETRERHIAGRSFAAFSDVSHGGQALDATGLGKPDADPRNFTCAVAPLS